jgi:hypothetical protein
VFETIITLEKRSLLFSNDLFFYIRVSVEQYTHENIDITIRATRENGWDIVKKKEAKIRSVKALYLIFILD